MSTGGNPDPSAKIKTIWGILVAGIAISLLLAGGLKAVQTATIVFALPFTMVILLMVIALWRAIREDWNEQQRQERELRRRIKQMTAQETAKPI
jgi:glycine betaine transporter